MDTLRQLLVLNQNNLDRLRSRMNTCRRRLLQNEANYRTQNGPYASYWDEWFIEMEEIITDLRSDIAATAHFTMELREFILILEANTEVSATAKRRAKKMSKLSLEALSCQKDMLSITDQRLTELREFTHKLLLVEAIDSLDEEG